LVGVPWGESARHLYVIHIDFAEAGIGRAKLVKALRDKGIGVQVHYLPVHLQPYYRDRYGSITLPGADSYYRNVLSLPLYAAMTNADVIYVIDMLEKSIRR
jgi:dTDP-4-amino-4,6-dideoxygalactose transaminase